MALFAAPQAVQEEPPPRRANLAIVATPAASYVSGHERLAGINDGRAPQRSRDAAGGAYGNWPRRGTQWVQYD